jgi:hypothetical protein
MTTASKQYLGDGVYVNFDGYQIELTTEDGLSTLNRIYLEPEVLAAFMYYIKSLREEHNNGPAL